jgi:hypothetical protein
MHGVQELAFQVCVNLLTRNTGSTHKKSETGSAHFVSDNLCSKTATATTALRQQNNRDASIISGVHMIESQKKSLMYVLCYLLHCDSIRKRAL